MRGEFEGRLGAVAVAAVPDEGAGCPSDPVECGHGGGDAGH